MPHAKRTASGVLGGLLGLVGLSAIAGILVTATVTPAIAVSGYAASSAISLFDSLPGALEVDRPMEPTTIHANTGDGDETYELASFYDQNREPVEYDEVSQTLYDAVLSSEDPRYYEHGGVDLIGTTRAVLSNAVNDSTQGGSSISQQYVKNVQVQACEREAARTAGDDQAAADQARIDCYNAATDSDGTDGYKRKLQEMRYAITIEQDYSKEEILLGYLNLANFGGTTYGIEAAAQRYFSTSAKDLTLTQAATLAGMVQNPNAYRIDMPDGSWTDDDGNPVNSAEDGYALTLERRNYVLFRMNEEGVITQEAYDQAREQPIEPDLTHRQEGCAAAQGTAYFCQYVKNAILHDDRYDEAFGDTLEERSDLLTRGGLDVYTTLDNQLQFQAQQSMEDHAPTHVDFMKFGAASVQLDAKTGNILSLAQNTRFDESSSAEAGESAQIYAADTEYGASSGFSVGSTYKLFTLVDWLENGRSVNEVVDGRSRVYDSTCNGVPIGNTDEIGNFNKMPGRVDDVRYFTAQSLNTGFLAMAEQLDICEIHDVATRMGAHFANGEPMTTSSWTPAVYDVLGSMNLSPVTVASAYATVANGGVHCEPTAILRAVDAGGDELPMPEPDCERAIDENIAATAAYALAGVMDATGSGANPRDGVPVVGKTGTHEAEQTWMVETSTNVTTAAWIGNYDSMVDASGNPYKADLYYSHTPNGERMSDLRYVIARENQAAANAKYGGDAFPEPDSSLTQVIEKDVPNVAGMSVDEATGVLEGEGFRVRVGGEVPGDQDKGLVESTDPSGQAPSGSLITLQISDGKGAVDVPDVTGMSPAQASRELYNAGLRADLGSCSERDGVNGRRVTGTDPSAGTQVSDGATVTVDWEASDCDDGGDGLFGGDDDNGNNGNGNGNGNNGNGNGRGNGNDD